LNNIQNLVTRDAEQTNKETPKKTPSLKNIINRISELNIKEKINILNFCKNNNIPFSQNINGYFFNFTNSNSNIINELNKLINIIEINKEQVKTAEYQRIQKEEELKKLLKEKESNSQKNEESEKLKKLIIKPNSVYLKINPIYNIRNLNKEAIFTEQEWVYKMKEIDLKNKRILRGNYNIPKNSSYERILKVIRSKKTQYKKEPEEEADEIELDIEENEIDIVKESEENVEDETLEEDLSEEIVDEEIVDEEIVDEEIVDEEIEVHDDDEELDENKHDQDLEEDPNYYEEPNDIEIKTITKLDIYNIKIKLKEKGFIFNENNDCILKKEDLLII
jgi:hypothetical protein